MKQAARQRRPRPGFTIRSARLSGTRVRCIVAGYPVVPKAHTAEPTEFIELNETGSVLRVEGDCVIVQFNANKHPFPVKLPRTHLELINKLEARGE